jgi:two-component system response regulator AtoC
MSTLLLIDDEPAIRHAFQKAFRDTYVLHTAGTAAEAVSTYVAVSPDVVILDVRLPDATGLETYHALRRLDARVPIILITGHGTTDLAIEAMKNGAFDYLSKPLELPALREQIDRAVRSSLLMRTPARFTGESTTKDGADETPPPGGDVLVGQCAPMQEVYKAIGRVAGQDVTVLILGESGTGKELVARAIYQHGRRADRPFLAINCGAIPESLIESELFGHEKGAFTGADRRRVGKFEQCDGGTLFLDEIGDMPPLAQVKLLRVLQERAFERVGGTETVRVDVRVIAATNADLDTMTADGRFRKDLFFRLNGFVVTLPPLRDRGDDLPRLVDYYLRRYEQELAKPVTDVPPETKAALAAYPWPGNVRELQSVLRQSLLQMSGTVLLPDFLPSQLTNVREARAATDVSAAVFDWDAFVGDRITAGSETVYAESLVRMEREVLIRVLKHTNGNQLQAARILGITRGSLRTKTRTLGITVGKTVWSDDEHTV